MVSDVLPVAFVKGVVAVVVVAINNVTVARTTGSGIIQTPDNNPHLENEK